MKKNQFTCLARLADLRRQFPKLETMHNEHTQIVVELWVLVTDIAPIFASYDGLVTNWIINTANMGGAEVNQIGHLVDVERKMRDQVGRYSERLLVERSALSGWEMEPL